MEKLFKRLSYANVVSTLALFIVLGGTAFAAAALPKASVGTRQLKKNAVISAKVKDHSLLRKDFKSGQVPRGPAGPAGAKGDTGSQGPKGDKGDKGDAATKYWARVVTFASGEIYSLTGTVTVTYAGATGKYTVAYPVAVNDCSTVVTMNVGINGGFFATPVIPSVAYGSDNQHSNLGFSDTSGGFVKPVGFNVATFC